VWPKGVKDETAAELLKNILSCAYLRIKPEADKELILAAFACGDELADVKTMKAAGISVRQDERFYIQVKEEEVS